MLADPQTLTINAVAKTLPRINQDNNGSTYRLRTTTEELVLTIKHSVGKISGGVSGETHTLTVKRVVFATTTVPALTSITRVSIQNGDLADLTVVKNDALALFAFLTGATVDKMLAGES